MTRETAMRSPHAAYRRDSAFSYVCHACCRCCHDKIIHLNPYEVARLAENRDISTTDFLSRYTVANGTALAQRENGACVFLTEQGCGVHEDRPLVCRLYPLGRKVTAEGEESFREVTPHPQTEGEYGTQGTVEDFLARQGTAPFINAVDRYVDVVGRMTGALMRTVRDDVQLLHDAQDIAGQVLDDQKHSMTDWIDMDLIVGQYCARHGLAIPTEVEAKMAVHIQAIDEWVQAM